MNINNITGPPVEGDNFFGREKELDFAWKHIKKGQSLILAAPRRVGKSSFAKKLLNFAEEEGWNTLEINLEEIKSEEGFVKLFIEKLRNQSWWEKTKSNGLDKINQILESIKPSFEYEGAKASVEWKSKKVDIYEQLKKLLDHESNTLIMVDELTILLNSLIKNDDKNGKQNVEFFLNWLRSFRQQTGSKIEWIFCSSVGIENFANLHGLSHTLNDVESNPIGAFTRPQAEQLFEALAKSENITLSKEIVNYTLDKIAWLLPYFIQLLFFNINRLVTVDDKPKSKETVDEAFETIADGKSLNTWDERLKEYNDLEMHARMLLNGLSKVREGESRNVLLNRISSKISDGEEADLTLSRILSMLRNDGYLDITPEDKYIFRSPLLRTFWYNKFSR